MSSLAAARADNFYYPPGFDPEKHGSLNQFQGQHPLRDRARKLDQGILVIRFEVPFNIWCQKCGEHIAKGVRFNAEKQQVGNYLSTKIWSFSMRHHCGSRIVIHTDPQHAEYIVKEGARRKVETYSAEDAETVELPGQKDKAALEDPFYRLEHGVVKRTEARAKQAGLVELREAADARHADNYQLNKALRAQMRESKKRDKQLDDRRKQLGLPEGMKLLPESEGDAQEAALALYNDDPRYKRKQRAHRQDILTQSIFKQAAGSHPLAASALLAAAAAGSSAGCRTTTSGSTVGGGAAATRTTTTSSTVGGGGAAAGSGSVHKRAAAGVGLLHGGPPAKKSLADKARQLAARRN